MKSIFSDKNIRKIKNWFSIQGVRISSFVKNHKYVSSLVVTLAFAGIIGLIVYATDENTIEANNLVQKTSDSSSDVYSFSTVSYTIEYDLTSPDQDGGNGHVVITAEITNDVDAKWETIEVPNGTSRYYEEDNGNSNPKKLIIEQDVVNVPQVATAKTETTLTMTVGNVKGNINYKFKVQDKEVSSQVTVKNVDENNNSLERDLRLKVLGGTPYNSGEYKNVPFGVVVGLDENLVNEIKGKTTGLRGYYFKSNLENISFTATEAPVVNASNSSAISVLTGENDFGSYASALENIQFSDAYHNLLQLNSNNGSITITHNEAGNSCSNIEINPLKSIGMKNVYMSNTYDYIDPLGDKITKITRIGTLTESVNQNIALSSVIKTVGGVTKISFENLSEDSALAPDQRGVGIYKIEYNLTNPVNDTKITYIRYFAVLAYGDAGYGSGEMVNYGSSLEELKSDINFCFEDEECIVKRLTVDGLDHGLSMDEVLEASFDEHETISSVEDLEQNKFYVAKYEDEGIDLYYFYGEVELTKSIKINKQGNDCILKYGDVQKTTTNTSGDGGQTIYTYNEEDFNISYSTSVIPASNNINITGIKVSNIPTTIENTNLFIDENAYKEIKNNQTNEYRTKIIPVASFYVTTQASKPAPNNPNVVTLGLQHTSSNDADSVEVNNIPPTRIIASLEMNTASESIYKVTGSEDPVYTPELTNLQRSLAYGEEIDVNYKITLDTERGMQKSGLSFKAYLNKDNSNYVFISDNSDSFEEGVEVRYYLKNSNEAVSKEEAIDQEIEYIEISNISLDGLESLDYNVTAHIKDSDASNEAHVNLYYEDSTNPQKKIELDAYAKTTPFKARTDIYLLGSDGVPRSEDISVQAESTNRSTLTVYPFVEDKSNSSLSRKVNVKIKVELPSNVTYISNENYLKEIQKETIDGKTVLTYILNNKKVNEIIEVISIDFEYNVNIPNNTVLEFKAIIEASDLSNSNITDKSNVEERTSIRRATYLSGSRVIARLSSSSASVMKNTGFDINVNLYNGTDEDKNGYLVIKIPQPSPEYYRGTYTLLNIEGLSCTLDMNNWNDCSEYEGSNYAGVTGLMLNYDMASKTSDHNGFRFNPSGNSSGNKYVFEAIIYQSSEDITGTKINSVAVEVTSLGITGTVWEDFNNNSLMDSDENNIKDIRFSLYDASNNQLVDDKVSDSNGAYSFDNLSNGTYYIVADYDKERYSLVETVSDLGNRAMISSFKLIDNVARTDNIVVDGTVLKINNYNLGLRTQRIYKVNMDKTITKLEITNALGITTTKDMGNQKLAKLDVKDMNSKIKVIYNIEVTNVGSYAGYVYRIKDYIPSGMSFNPDYDENKNWSKSSEEYIEYYGLYNSSTVLEPGIKHNISLALDISTKEAGSFLNYAIIEEDDMRILGGEENEE